MTNSTRSSSSFATKLEAAAAGEIDLVGHGGRVFNIRSINYRRMEATLEDPRGDYRTVDFDVIDAFTEFVEPDGQLTLTQALNRP